MRRSRYRTFVSTLRPNNIGDGRYGYPWGHAEAIRYGHTLTVPLIDASSATAAGTLQVWCTLAEPHPFDVETSAQIARHGALERKCNRPRTNVN